MNEFDNVFGYIESLCIIMGVLYFVICIILGIISIYAISMWFYTAIIFVFGTTYVTAGLDVTKWRTPLLKTSMQLT